MTSVDDLDRVADDPWCRAYSLGLRFKNPCPVPVVWEDAVFVLVPGKCALLPVDLVAPVLVDGDVDGDAPLLP